MPRTMNILALAAAVAVPVLAGGDDWEGYGKSTTTTSWYDPKTTGWNEKCEPWTEEYVCDDEEGEGEYTTTFTKYSKGCASYTEYPEWTKPAKTTAAWNTWATGEAKPSKGPKGPKGHKGEGDDDDEESWSTSTWEDPKTTEVWNTWSSEDAYPSKGPKGPKGHGKHGEDDDAEETWSTWVDPKPTETWSSWPKTTDPAQWEDVEYDSDGKKVVVITWTEEYEVPCSTGWEKKTTTVYGKHCGCTETPVPEHPAYTTYTTECPESWGVGKTVTVTVPAATWTPKSVKAETTATTWATWAEASATSSKPADASASTWATWATWSTSTKPAAASASTWATWSTSSKPADAAATSWSPVATWKGAASSTAVNKIMVVLAGAAAGAAAFIL